MISIQSDLISKQTEDWIKTVVVACNFCPFANSALIKKSIKYIVLSEMNTINSIEALEKEFQFLNNHQEIETTFIIFSEDFTDFSSYLHLVSLSENALFDQSYEGIYQLASFHPDYCFHGADNNDAANYTNRSPYPMLHLLREDSITKVLQNFAHPENIPDNNILFAREKGLKYMQLLRSACM